MSTLSQKRIGSGTITPLPPGGSTGQVLSKLSAVDYSVGWTTVEASGGSSGSRNIDGGTSFEPHAPGFNVDGGTT